LLVHLSFSIQLSISAFSIMVDSSRASCAARLQRGVELVAGL
jgi:hypothetical protein